MFLCESIALQINMKDNLILIKTPNFLETHPPSTKDSNISVIDFDVDTPVMEP